MVCAITYYAFDLRDLAWGTPLDFRGDSLLTMSAIQNMIQNGWYFHTNHLGFPLGQYLQDFPAPADGLFLLSTKVLSQVFSNPANVFNFLVLSAFPLNYCGAFVGLRMMRIPAAMTVAGAVMYAMLPYNFLHGPGHVGLLWNFSIPIWVAFLVRQLSDDPILHKWANPFRTQSADRIVIRATIGTLAVGVLAATTGFYYFAFFLVLATPVAVLEVWRERSLLRSSVALSIATSLVCFGMQILPIVTFQRTYGRNTSSAARTLSEVATWGLKPLALFTPPRYTRLKFLSHWFGRVWPDSVSAENATALGILIAVTVLITIVGSYVLGKRDELELVKRLSQMLFFCLFLAVPYGGAYLLGGLGFTQVRVWSRIAIVIGFIGIAIFWELCSQVRSRLNARSRRSVGIFTAFISLLALLQLVDSVPTTSATSRNEITHDWASMRRLVRQIDARIGRHARIFQLPLVPFPESPPVNLMTDYEHLKPYLVDPNKFFGYGGVKGRSLPWAERLATDPEIQIEEIRTAGFDALWIDQNGWPSGADPYESVLIDHFKLKPIFGSAHRYVVFDIRSIRVRPAIKERQAELVSPITTELGSGFWPEETDGHISWHWAGTYGFLHLRNLARREATVEIKFEIELRKTGQLTFDRPCRVSPANVQNVYSVSCKVQVPITGATIRISSTVGPIDDDDPRDLRFRILNISTRVVSVRG